MTNKYDVCGHAKLLTDKNGKMRIVKCVKRKRHEDEEHDNGKGDRWVR